MNGGDVRCLRDPLTDSTTYKLVPSLGTVQFAPSTDLVELLTTAGADKYHPQENCLRLVSTISSRLILAPELSPSDLDGLGSKARGALRVGVAEALGVGNLYSRLAGSPLSGDERILLALRSTAYVEPIGKELSPLSLTVNRDPVRVPPWDAMANAQEHIDRMLRPPAIQKFFDDQDRLSKMLRPKVIDPLAGIPDPMKAFRSPTLDAMANAQKHIDRMQRPPAIQRFFNNQDRLSKMLRPKVIDPLAGIPDPMKAFRSPTLDAMANAQKHIEKFLRPPAIQKFLANQDRLSKMLRPKVIDPLAGIPGPMKAFRSPTLDAMANAQKHIDKLLRPSSIRGLFDPERVRYLVDELTRGAERAYDATVVYFADHWVEEGHSADRPPPVMFVIAMVPIAFGITLYESVKQNDDSELLGLMEPVLTDGAFVEEIQAAVVKSPILHDPSRQQLILAIELLHRKDFVNAYPLFYAGLESAFTETARARGIIDETNAFLVKSPQSKARKTEDLLAHLELSPRYTRYLRGWIFGEEGNPFRHGDISEAELCRRQALRLAAALVGWLEECGGWVDARLAERIEAGAHRLLEGGDES